MLEEAKPMTIKSLEHVVIQTLEGYLKYPATTDHERGYLSAFLMLYHETKRAYFFDEEMERLLGQLTK